MKRARKVQRGKVALMRKRRKKAAKKAKAKEEEVVNVYESSLGISLLCVTQNRVS